MLNCIKRFLRNRRGSSAVEFALYLPVLMILVVGMSEVSVAIMQSVALEKSLRSGALYASRANLPLSDATRTEVTNIIKKGNTAGTGSYLIDSWNESSATLSISVSNYTMATTTSVLGSNQLPVITVTAIVPYRPILSDLLSAFGMGVFTLSLSQQQAHIGV